MFEVIAIAGLALSLLNTVGFIYWLYARGARLRAQHARFLGVLERDISSWSRRARPQRPCQPSEGS